MIEPKAPRDENSSSDTLRPRPGWYAHVANKIFKVEPIAINAALIKQMMLQNV